MAVDIKKVLTSLKERKETTLVWGLGAVALCLGVFLLIGFMRGVSPPASLEVIVKRPKSLKSKEEIAEEVVAKLKKTQKIPPFIEYQDILTRSLFLKSRAGAGIREPGVGTGSFELKGIIQMPDKTKAFINDPVGKPHLVGVSQRIGTSEVKVVVIDFENQSATLMHKDWPKPQVLRMAREEIKRVGDMITFKPSEKKKAAEKPKGVTEEEAKKAAEKPKGVTEEEAKKAIAEAKEALSDASDVILTARSEGGDTGEAEDRRDDAKVKLQDAQEAMKEKDYQRAKESAKSAQALAREAKRLVGEAEEEAEEEEELREEEVEEGSGGPGGGLAF